MLNLIEKENLLLTKCRKAAIENTPIYIYGGGQLGHTLCNRLIKDHIPVAGFLVDSEFCKSNESYKNVPFFCIDKTDLSNNELLIIAFRDYTEEKVNQLKEKTNVLDLDVMSFHCVDEECIDYEYISRNRHELDKLYQSLADDKSREHMNAYLNQKISGDYKYLQNIWEQNQYFDSGIVDFSKIGTFVDCGAYDGDTYFSFLKKYKECIGEDYKGNVYLFEPDPYNYDKLVANFESDNRYRIMRVGVGRRKSSLTFSAQGNISKVTQNGDISIDIDAIDNICSEGADFIKMDIEGSEMEALMGAEQTIRKFKPTLAICVYHKKEDLITIPQYIKSLCEEYKLYIRAHSRHASELVLYAVL